MPDEGFRIRKEAIPGAGEAGAPTSALAEGSGGEDWARLVNDMLVAMDRKHRGWTLARKKESITRLTRGAAGNMPRLHERLRKLITGWDQGGEDSAPVVAPGTLGPEELHARPINPVDPTAGCDTCGLAPVLLSAMRATLGGEAGVPTELTEAIEAFANDLGTGVAKPAAAATIGRAQRLAERLGRLHVRRAKHVQQMRDLLLAFAENAEALAESGSWVQGQMKAVRAQLDGTMDRETLTGVINILRQAAQRQQLLRASRDEAQTALKHMLSTLIERSASIGDTTGAYAGRVGTYLNRIENAPDLESLNDVVHSLLNDTRVVGKEMGDSHGELVQARERAQSLEERVRSLEAELCSVSEQVYTDHLTQALNRRGLDQAWETANARARREGSPLCLSLLDVDNFKQLNDEFGHATGDEALRRLVATVRTTLRPHDVVARYGGEEFVLLLPSTTTPEACEVMIRVQRALTAAIFLHDERRVVVTFSAGVTLLSPQETLEEGLQRADEALYRAKVAGKNRVLSA